MRDVADVIDGPAEVDSYTWVGFGPKSDRPKDASFYPAVAVSVAKKKGTNAVWVAKDVEARLEKLSATLFPPEVHYKLTRNNGETANEKVNELVEGLVVAVLTVIIFIGLFLGWRAAIVVALAVPVCYGATLLIKPALRLHDQPGDALRAHFGLGPAGGRPDHRRGEYRALLPHW